MHSVIPLVLCVLLFAVVSSVLLISTEAVFTIEVFAVL